MDRTSEIQALFEEQNVWEPKPKHLYEGTDSEDDQDPTLSARIDDDGVSDDSSSEFKGFDLEQGELASEGERFCPWQVVKRYPFVYIGVANRVIVAEEFFDNGKLYDRTWDFFYIHRTSKDFNQQPILLVPTEQFKGFLDHINRNLGIFLTIPAGSAKNGFMMTFGNDGTPRPRYLGQSTSKEIAETLKNNTPPSYYRIDGEPQTIMNPSETSLAIFRDKIDQMVRAQKGKKLASKEKQKTERIAQQQSWGQSIKRVQRYLGIREVSHAHHAAIRASLENSGLQWEEYDAAVKDAAGKLSPSAMFDCKTPAPFDQEGSVVFVCIDVEAYERNAGLITEIGVATLDTKDITQLSPGNGGVNWMDMIRARHFRINEYKHLQNQEFVNGCADKFEFGTSEFINLKDAPHVISTCFKHPFSKLQPETPTIEDSPMRNIILVGHDVKADINFLRSIGYDVYNLSNLQELADTATMWRYLKRDSQPRNLGSVLAELGITGWNLHNAGNDAVYTLQALLAISLKHIEDKQKSTGLKVLEMKTRSSDSPNEDPNVSSENDQGWSSGGDKSDGGAAVPPAATPASGSKSGTSSYQPGSNRNKDAPAKGNAKTSNGRRKMTTQGSGNQLISDDDSWGIVPDTLSRAEGVWGDDCPLLSGSSMGATHLEDLTRDMTLHGGNESGSKAEVHEHDKESDGPTW